MTERKYDSYIPLHGHTTYSISDGVCKIDDLVDKAINLKFKGLAVTEHGNLSSFFKFYKYAKLKGIKPILGSEVYINDLYFDDNEKFLELKRKKKVINDNDEEEFGKSADNSHLVVYAKNFDGLQNLIKLVNHGFFNFYRKPLVSNKLVFDLLDENNIVTTACLNGEIPKLIRKKKHDEALALIKRYHEKFGDDFYLEILLNGMKEQNEVNDFYKLVYENTGIKPVFALDYHYVDKADYYIQYLLYTIKQRGNVREYPIDDWFYNVRDLYLKSIDEVYKTAEKHPIDMDFFEVALGNTIELSNKINIELPEYPDNFPKFSDDDDANLDLFLNKLHEKWEEKLANGLIPKEKEEEYSARLKYELEIIIDKKFVDYFLIIDDLLNNFVYKVGGATGAGRGCFVPESFVKLSDGSRVHIKDIKIGDIVKNYFNEKAKVVNKFKYNVDEELIELELENGEKITCTKDHKIYTKNRGWIEAKNISLDDDLQEI